MIDKDWAWVNEHNTFGVQLENASDRYGQLAVQGPKATEMLQLLTDADLSAIPYYAFREWSFAGVQGVILSNTGYTGAGGFELYFPKEHSQQIWDALFEVGKPFGLAPIGLGARDSLRLEKWYCLYGHDIDDTTSPLEAGLGWITKFDAKDFIDKEFLLKQKAEGVHWFFNKAYVSCTRTFSSIVHSTTFNFCNTRGYANHNSCSVEW